jgi:hypothetical protein
LTPRTRKMALTQVITQGFRQAGVGGDWSRVCIVLPMVTELDLATPSSAGAH